MNTKPLYAALLLLAVTPAQAKSLKPLPTAGSYTTNVSLGGGTTCFVISDVNPVARTFKLNAGGGAMPCTMERLTPLTPAPPDPATLPETGSFYCSDISLAVNGSFSVKSFNIMNGVLSGVKYVFKPVVKAVLDTKGACV